MDRLLIASHLVFLAGVVIPPFVSSNKFVLWTVLFLQYMVILQWQLFGGCVLNPYDGSENKNTSVLVRKFADMTSLHIDDAKTAWVILFNAVPVLLTMAKLIKN